MCWQDPDISSTDLQDHFKDDVTLEEENEATREA